MEGAGSPTSLRNCLPVYGASAGTLRSHREHSVFPCMEADVVESGEWPLNVESKIWESVGSKDKKKINHSSGRRSCLNGKGRGDKEAE